MDQVLEVFPWYEQLLRDNGVDKEAIQSIRELPLFTSELLEQHYYNQEQPFGRQDNVTAYRTSGTSSLRRKTIYYSAEDEQNYLDIKADLFQRFLRPSDPCAAISDMGTGHAANTAVEVFTRIGIHADSIPFQQPIEQHLDKLRSFRPQVLYTMPSILDHLLSASADDLSDYGIRQIILVGEIASPAWLHSVAERLRIPAADITDTYGSIEIGTIAYYSHEHERYLFAEGIEAEGVSAEALFSGIDPLGEGESVLVLTSLVRDLFPALRYVTYDIVRDLRPILVAGEWRMSFKAVVRRLGSELKHGEKISVYDIEDVVYRHLKEALVRIHVRANKLSVHIDSDIKDPGIYEQIELELLDRIPEIGIMIRGGMLDALRVIPSDVAFDSAALKHKKIFYD
ncbi:CoF synthetase [Cohnella sp. NL03-T5]|nr:CoF synthetase [Cohnella silvisoli]